MVNNDFLLFFPDLVLPETEDKVFVLLTDIELLLFFPVFGLPVTGNELLLIFSDLELPESNDFLEDFELDADLELEILDNSLLLLRKL